MAANETHDPLLRTALAATCETAPVDFKAELDVEDKGAWLEILKDIVAMANSGGGIILFGLDDSGNPTGSDVAPILDYDASRIGDKLRKYTGLNFGGFSLLPVQRGAAQIAAIRVTSSPIPIVFTADGQYVNEHGQDRFAFRQGTVYFRHGAKSEPGTTDDLRASLDREVERVKASWLTGIRQIVEAPPGAVVSVGLPVQPPTSNNPDRVCLVTDPKAPGVVLMDPNKTHPYRLKEVVTEVNRSLSEGVTISAHDLLGIRRLYQTDSNPAYRYKPNTGSNQYSDALVQWIVDQITADKTFLPKLRERHHQWVTKLNTRRQNAAAPPPDWACKRN